MQPTSELYKTLIADPGHVKECRLIVAGEEYDSDRIVSMETDGSLFEQDTVCVGSAVSRQLDVVLYGAGEIPKGAKLIPEYRIRSGDQVSEWMRKGVFYIDTRDPRAATGTLTIHAFDDFMRMEAEYIPSQDLEFPMPMDRAAKEIAGYYGLTIDSRSRLRSDYFIDYPTPGTSGRTLMKWIAAAHGGNWTMTDNGEARLVRLRDLDSETGSLVTERGRVILIGGVPILVGKTAENAYDGPSDKVFVGPNTADASAPPALDPISKIVILVDDENYYEAGDDSGLTLELTCPYGSQSMADDLLDELGGYRHVPLEAQDALIDPAAEIGDGVTVNGVYTILASMATTFDTLMPSDIGAPGQRETESEIGKYSGPIMKELNRKLGGVRSYITKTASEIQAMVEEEVSGLSASITVELQSITQRVEGLKGQYTEVKTTLDGLTVTDESGTTRIKGSSIETGSIAAGSIRADQVQLSGAITWSDLDSGAQGKVNTAQSTAESARSTANSASSAASAAQRTANTAQSTAEGAQSTANAAKSAASNAQDTINSWGYYYRGTTYIDGEMLMTGTVKATKLMGGTVSLLDEDEYPVGGIDIAWTDTNNFGLNFYTNYGGIRILSAGNLYLGTPDTSNHTGSHILLGHDATLSISAQKIKLEEFINSDLKPVDNTWDLGAGAYRWKNVYVINGAIQTSDERLKENIEDIPDKYVDMVSRLRPVRYKNIEGTSGRYHVGFIAQEVKAVMDELGIDSTEFGGYVADVDEDSNPVYMLRYEEFIGIIWATLRRFAEKISALEAYHG